MDIIVKGRHTDVNDRFRRHVDNKLARIERLDQKVIRVDVEVSEERNPRQADRRERVELTIRSRGPAIRAEAAAEDRYGALDIAIDKLESRLRRSRDRRKIHYGSGSRAPAKLAHMPPLPDLADIPSVPEMTGPANGKNSKSGRNGKSARDRTAAPAEPADLAADPDSIPEPAATGIAEENIVPIPMEGDGPVVVREKHHIAEPMGIEQALFEMELVGHDFYLFRDKACGLPSVVYRRRGWDYGVIRLVED